MDLRNFRIQLESKGLKKEYEMTEALWIDDMSLQQQCTDQHGNLNAKELWIKRLAVAIGKSENEIRRLPFWELAGLTTKWLEINEPDKAIFLEDSRKEEKNNFSNSTS